MRLGRRSAALIASLALVAAIATAFYWQPITNRLSPPLPAAPENLIIAISSDVSSGLVRIAAAKGYFAAEGLTVTLQPHTSGRSGLAAVIANQAEIATAADIPVMFAATGKLPISIVATIADTLHAEGILARRDRGVAAPADLKGKTIGVPFGTSSHFMLNVILSSHAISPLEVPLRNLPPEALAAALAAGEVDAIAIWRPWLDQAGKAAGANGVSFFPEKGFGFRFHLVGRREFVGTHPAAMQKLLRAVFRAEQYAAEDAPAARALITESAHIDPAVIDAIWPYYDLRLTLSQAILNMLEDQARWAIANGLVDAKAEPNFLEVINPDAMLAVKPAAVSIVR